MGKGAIAATERQAPVLCELRGTVMANMPSAEDIIIQKEVLQERWAKRNEMIEEQRALRFMENNIKLHAEMEAEEVRSPIGHQIAERMTGQPPADPPTITVPPASERQK